MMLDGVICEAIERGYGKGLPVEEFQRKERGMDREGGIK